MLGALQDIDAHFRTASVEVREMRPTQGEDAAAAAAQVKAYLDHLTTQRERFLALTTEIQRGVTEICEADHDFSMEVRREVRRGEESMRFWAPKFAMLRVSELTPLAVAFPAWHRSYNDALTAVVRASLDAANRLRERLREEEAEDAAAEEWAMHNEPLTGDEETVSLAEVIARSKGAA